MAVVRTVAAYSGRPPKELPPLFEVVDPDALDLLFQPLDDGTPRQGGAVAFEYAGYHVRIDFDGRVDVSVSCVAD